MSPIPIERKGVEEMADMIAYQATTGCLSQGGAKKLILEAINQARMEEREAAAKIAESFCPHDENFKGVNCREHDIAKAIRSRV